ncbi:MAG: thioesterase [Alphaproteobacteria bacterium]|nr:thioesterase family protein [Alphaproteobacteria bacterium]TAD90163.1 MAG: thioesterase [Alphaproteobacteria bacterium]
MHSLSAGRRWLTTRLPVRPDWIDYNDHLNVAAYAQAFDVALEEALHPLGLGEAFLPTTGHTVMVLQSSIQFLSEVTAGATLSFTFMLMDFDTRRLHWVMELSPDDGATIAAVTEQVAIHVNLATRRAALFPEDVSRRIGRMALEDAQRPRPRWLGRPVGLSRSPDGNRSAG